MTDAEKKIWGKLRRKQLKKCQFYRRRVIGKYIVDFFCSSAKLVIEIDDGQHYTKDGMGRDKIRDDYIKNLGIKILRFTDREVLQNIDLVLGQIYENL